MVYEWDADKARKASLRRMLVVCTATLMVLAIPVIIFIDDLPLDGW